MTDSQTVALAKMRLELRAQRALLEQCRDVLEEMGADYVELSAYLRGAIGPEHILAMIEGSPCSTTPKTP